MCTAATLTTSDHYFGRNLDLEVSFGEGVTITPRNFEFEFRRAEPLRTHHAMIGMATVADGYPLYYDATNEHGLSMAGLNFPENAVYFPEADGATNITPFEFIPWILGQCEIDRRRQGCPRGAEPARRLVQRAVPALAAALDHRRP